MCPDLRPQPLPAALEACPGGTATGEAYPPIAKRLHELLATVAMQFGGYIFRLSESQVRAGVGVGGLARARVCVFWGRGGGGAGCYSLSLLLIVC